MFAALLLALPALAPPQDPPLVGQELLDLLHEELSGELAKESVIAITRHHRIQGARGYSDSAQWLLGELRGFGFAAPDAAGAAGQPRAWIESFPSDGKIVYQTWQSPSGWHVETAELRMLEPVAERIVGYPEIAMSLVTYSNAGEATGELVFVGAGTSEADYAGKDVRGKFVLASGYGGAVHRLAVLGHGAAAVVCYLDDERALEHPDMLAYTGMWPKSGELEDTMFGFNLTHRQGERLRKLLEAGQKVVLQGKVEGPGLEPGRMDVVVATIPGNEEYSGSDKELVFTAHLDHPKESANDNASGSAAILDIARGLQKLIAEGRLRRPLRTLRFLWIPEWNGTMAYLDAHPEFRGPELGGKVLAGLNLDMVGEDLEQLHSKLILTRTPDSLPSALNTLIADTAAAVDRMNVRTPRGSRSAFNWRVTRYSGGSDHMMLIDRKIPAVMFSHDPDYTHHTSEDTPDKVDPVQLERCELIAAGTIWYLSMLSLNDSLVDGRRSLEGLARMVAGDGMRRIAADGRVAHNEVRDYPIGVDIRDGRLKMDHALAQELAALDSIRTFVTKTEYLDRALLPQLREGLIAAHRTQIAAGRGILPNAWEDTDGDARVPRRLTRGPLDFGLPESGIDAARAAWYASAENPFGAEMRFELVNFVDGARSVQGIRDALSSEFRSLPLEAVARYCEDLVAAGVMEWR
ncbi:MAG TPA: DUF4910 domain-containing protein [Planctomycetota bacterium]